MLAWIIRLLPLRGRDWKPQLWTRCFKGSQGVVGGANGMI